jgi:hypothetical protein
VSADHAMFRLLWMREAIASVSLSHPPGCDCDTCKAAQGDEEAFVRVVEAVEAEEERRRHGTG